MKLPRLVKVNNKSITVIMCFMVLFIKSCGYFTSNLLSSYLFWNPYLIIFLCGVSYTKVYRTNNILLKVARYDGSV